MRLFFMGIFAVQWDFEPVVFSSPGLLGAARCSETRDV